MLTRTLRLAAAALIGAAALAPSVAGAQAYRGPPPGFDDRGFYERAGYERGDDRRSRRRDPYEGRRGNRGRPDYRHCDRGTGGTILGAIAGGLLGNSVMGRGDRGTGTIVGAGVGALAGRAVDRDC